MNLELEELQEAWKSQDTRATVRIVLLLESIRKKTRYYNRVLFLRNVREGWGTILAAIFFICFAESDAASKSQLWPFYLAMAILFGIGVFRVRDNIRQKRKALQYSNSAMSFIECSLMQINHRIWLLENIFWWWVLPVSVGGLLIVAQIILLVGMQDPITLYLKLGKGVGIVCVILAAVYWGNLWTARKYWQPRKTELEAISDSLKVSDSAP